MKPVGEYMDIVNALRHCYDISSLGCTGCPKLKSCDGSVEMEAADAIEELLNEIREKGTGNAGR